MIDWVIIAPTLRSSKVVTELNNRPPTRSGPVVIIWLLRKPAIGKRNILRCDIASGTVAFINGHIPAHRREAKNVIFQDLTLYFLYFRW